MTKNLFCGYLLIGLMVHFGNTLASSISNVGGSRLRYLGTPSVTAGATSLKCGRNLINLGDHKLEVLDVCGEPESVNTRTIVLGNTVHFPHRTIDLQEYEEVQVEEWVYNFGSKRFRQYLRFENERLVEIKSLGRTP